MCRDHIHLLVLVGFPQAYCKRQSPDIFNILGNFSRGGAVDNIYVIKTKFRSLFFVYLPIRFHRLIFLNHFFQMISNQEIIFELVAIVVVKSNFHLMKC